MPCNTSVRTSSCRSAEGNRCVAFRFALQSNTGDARKVMSMSKRWWLKSTTVLAGVGLAGAGVYQFVKGNHEGGIQTFLIGMGYLGLRRKLERGTATILNLGSETESLSGGGSSPAPGGGDK